MTEKRRRTRRIGISTAGALLGGVLLGVVLLYAVAYVGAVPGLTPSVTLQLEFQDLSEKMDDVLDEFDSLSQAIQSQISALATDVSTLTSQLTTLTGDLADIQSALEDALIALEGIPTQLSALSDDVSRLRTDIDLGGAFYSFVEGGFSTIRTAITDAQSAIVAEINANETKIDDIEAKLDVGGAFYAFVDSWFTTIQTAITNAQTAIQTAITNAKNIIVAEIDANEAKINDIEAKLDGKPDIKHVTDTGVNIAGDFAISVNCNEDFQVKAVYARVDDPDDTVNIKYDRVWVRASFGVLPASHAWLIGHVDFDPAGGAASEQAYELLSQLQVRQAVGVPGGYPFRIWGIVQSTSDSTDDTLTVVFLVESAQSSSCTLFVLP